MCGLFAVTGEGSRLSWPMTGYFSQSYVSNSYVTKLCRLTGASQVVARKKLLVKWPSTFTV